MKKFIKKICLLLSVMLTTAACASCSKDESAKVDLTNAPDYSASTEQFTVFAYNGVCDDWYQRNGVRYYLDESLATVESLQQYVDGGFNYLFVDWVFQEAATVDGYNFENGKLKEVLDMADQVGLKCVVFQPEIQSLSNSEESRINAEKAATVNETTSAANMFFNSQEDMNAYVAKALKGLKDHPAFDGVILIDEPKYTKFQAISEVYQAVIAADPDCFVMLNLLPFAENSNQHKDLYCGSIEYSSEEAYRMYLDEYYEKVGKYMGYVQYDDYPILEDGILSTFLYGNKVVSEFCAEKGLKRTTLYQTLVYSNRRPVMEADVYFQMNVGQAFGNRSYCWYTYYPLINTTKTYLNEADFIVDYTGTPTQRYYWVQAATEEMQHNAKALMHFEYQGMQYQVKAPVSSLDYINRLENDEFKLLKGYTFEMKVQTGGIVLVTELYDETNDRYGYYAVNITDPQYTSEAIVELDFGSYEYAQVYQFGKTTNTCTNDGKIKISLGSGRGAFIMPF